MDRKFVIPFGGMADYSIDYLMGMLYDARAMTFHYVDGITTEELDWQYRDGWNTVGALLSHLSAAQDIFRIVFVEDRKMTAEEEARWTPGIELGKYLSELRAGRTLESYRSELAEGRDRLETALRQLSTEEFHRRREGYDDETGCNLAWVLYHLVEDEVHHRGQISLIRKLYASEMNAS